MDIRGTPPLQIPKCRCPNMDPAEDSRGPATASNPRPVQVDVDPSLEQPACTVRRPAANTRPATRPAFRCPQARAERASRLRRAQVRQSAECDRPLRSHAAWPWLGALLTIPKRQGREV